MKRRLIIITAFSTILLFVQGCTGATVIRGSNNLAEETREVSGFSGVDLGTVGKVVIELGEEEALRIEAEDNLLEQIETEVIDGILHITTHENVTILPGKPVYFYVTARNLNTLAVSGLGSIDAVPISADRFTVGITGGGDINLAGINAGALDVDISGLGNLFVESGDVTNQSIYIGGGGNHRARDLASNSTEVVITGLGSATVWAKDRLSVDIGGGGSVKYVGNPVVEKNVSGLGRVEQLGE